MSARRILVTGGAGYIGSHVVKALTEKGYTNIVVLDNLTTGFANMVVEGASLIVGDIHDRDLLSTLFQTYAFDTVMHFAACTVVPESLVDPLKYYQNNFSGTLQLLDICSQYHVNYFIFSSTAAVYGINSENNITESHPIAPIHPYGRSKWMCEEAIKDFCRAYNSQYMILRYFNVAGADPSGQLGQQTKQASHLIKAAVEAACRKRAFVPIFGSDYPTPDGTCIRDYIHVWDLAQAHIQALEYLEAQGNSCILNCGYGKGFSVKEVIETLESVSQIKIPITLTDRREGDLARVVADNTRLKQILQWQPQFEALSLIVKSAYEYEKRI